jgi:hypothetical protein
MALAKLEILQPQGCHLGPPEATADEKREQSTISPTGDGVAVFSAEQLLAFLGPSANSRHALPAAGRPSHAVCLPPDPG